MTPQSFIQKWGPGGPAFHLNEEQGAPKPGNYLSLRFGTCNYSVALSNPPILVDRINFTSAKTKTKGAD